MKVLVVSEGKHELGDAQQEGALVVLVRRTLSKSAELVPRRMADRNVRVHLRPGEGRGFVKRTLAWIRFAEQNGFAALVLVIDQDGCREREEELETAQADSHVTLPRALGVAIRTFDAWMLADEVALSRALACEIPRQKDPESLRDPKRVCRNLLDESGGPMSQAALYAAIADFADLDLVAERCPRGFAPLLERLRSLSDLQTAAKVLETARDGHASPYIPAP